MASVRVIHPLAPIVDQDCEILILGSFPSVKSREEMFYYAHPQNRFWRVMSALCHCDVPDTNQGKKEMLLKNHIALWDSIHSCTIQGSSDSSIKDVIPNDIHKLIQGTKISKIYCNGQMSLRVFKKYQKNVNIQAQVLPSTSPANAAYSLARLIEIYTKTINS